MSIPRWITCDQGAADALRHRLDCPVMAIPDPAEALRSLLQSPTGIVVLPGNSRDYALIATVRSSGGAKPPSQNHAAQPQREPRQIATGFLGLVDELVWEEEEAPKPSWWRKLID